MPTEHPAPRPLIILVNDDEIQRRPLAVLLERHGLRVSAQASVRTALEAMAAEPPALVITDLCLPDIDGVRFCRMLRSPAYARFNETPILVASATYAGADTGSIIVDLGANDFVRLPVEPELLLQRVDRLLHHALPAAEPTVFLISADAAESATLAAAFAANG